MKELVGRTINDVSIDQDKERIRFITDEGPFVYRADGDCCSSSWFESISDKDHLVGSKITDVFEKESIEIKHPDHECLQVYGYTLTTDKGHCDVEFRNASNGYYGGSCVLESKP